MSLDWLLWLGNQLKNQQLNQLIWRKCKQKNSCLNSRWSESVNKICTVLGIRLVENFLDELAKCSRNGRSYGLILLVCGATEKAGVEKPGVVNRIVFGWIFQSQPPGPSQGLISMNLNWTTGILENYEKFVHPRIMGDFRPVFRKFLPPPYLDLSEGDNTQNVAVTPSERDNWRWQKLVGTF